MNVNCADLSGQYKHHFITAHVQNIAALQRATTSLLQGNVINLDAVSAFNFKKPFLQFRIEKYSSMLS